MDNRAKSVKLVTVMRNVARAEVDWLADRISTSEYFNKLDECQTTLETLLNGVNNDRTNSHDTTK